MKALSLTLVVISYLLANNEALDNNMFPEFNIHHADKLESV